MNYLIPSPLLPFLGACVHGDAASFYCSLSEPERAELEAQGNGFGLTAWFYRYLLDVLPKEKRTEYQKIYQAQQARALMGGQELKRLYKVLADHGLRFVPIKGADLACRVYPDAALRTFCDWDIWFHPDDCNRALAVLKEDGWMIPASLPDDHEAVMNSKAHHFSLHTRGQYAVEPHFKLANFHGVTPQEMWDETTDCPDGDGQRVLSPEMNLLMLTRHAATDSYFHTHIPKLLTDAAFVMQKEKVDFARLRSMAARWHFPYPGDLLASFPEFFSPAEIGQFKADPQKTAEFRQLFELRGQMNKPSRAALLFGRSEARNQVTGGLMNHIRRMLAPSMIRLTYHLPPQGAWGSVAWAYLCYLCTRTWRVLFIWAQRDQLLQQYSKIVESIESADSPSNRTN